MTDLSRSREKFRCGLIDRLITTSLQTCGSRYEKYRKTHSANCQDSSSLVSPEISPGEFQHHMFTERRIENIRLPTLSLERKECEEVSPQGDIELNIIVAHFGVSTGFREIYHTSIERHHASTHFPNF